MGYALPRTDAFTEMSCGACGIVFYVPERWRSERERTGEGFHCPNGHARVYRETTADTLRKELAEKERLLTWEKQRADTLDKRLKAEAKKRVQLQKRVEAGVCPHCQRTFSQLAAHMKTQHAEQLDVVSER